MAEKYRGVEYDELRLLRLICRMANMSEAGVQKVVLVCEVGAAPVVYVQSLLQPIDDIAVAEAELMEAGRGIQAEAVESVIVDTTTQQNKVYVTKQPLTRDGEIVMRPWKREERP